jgi:hypothetical protein
MSGLYSRLKDSAVTPEGFDFFCDFIRQDEIADGGSIDGTAISSGTIATQATNGGWARLSGAATTDDSGYQIQALAAHAPTDGKLITFKARLQVSETTSTNVATESDLYVGLFPVDTSIVASLPTDGIYFVKADGGTSISCVVRAASTNVSVVWSGTFDKLVHTYGIMVRPDTTNSTNNSIVSFSIDGVEVARSAPVAIPASTVILTPTIAFQSGDNTGTKFVDVDYIGTYQDR